MRCAKNAFLHLKWKLKTLFVLKGGKPPLIRDTSQTGVHTKINSDCDQFQKFTTQYLPPPRFLDDQLPVCVHENESRILMHFQTEPHIRNLAR